MNDLPNKLGTSASVIAGSNSVVLTRPAHWRVNDKDEMGIFNGFIGSIIEVRLMTMDHNVSEHHSLHPNLVNGDITFIRWYKLDNKPDWHAFEIVY